MPGNINVLAGWDEWDELWALVAGDWWSFWWICTGDYIGGEYD
jgi:hypothetical protein